MGKTRPILYGVADYAEIRKANAWFIDRTAKIRDLEGTRYALFLRPRRFGKSLLLSILEGYYDIERADRFEELFSGTGVWRNFIDVLAAIVKENFAVRDAVEGEKVVQSTLVALLCAAGGPYYVRHEREAGGGFYDIALAPQLDRWPEIAHAALIEMKYVKSGDPVPTPEQLDGTKAKAMEQLDGYSSDSALVVAWHLKAGQRTEDKGQMVDGRSTPQTVSLHRIVLVFHGGDCVLAEEA